MTFDVLLTTINLVVVILVWEFVGVKGFIYWWTKHYDLKISMILLLLMVGFMGPLSFIFGWAYLGNFKNIILIKKKE